MRDRTAHCAEAAFFAAAAFRVHGRPPLVMDLESERDDDHVLAPYRDRGLWGTVALSKFSGLRFRAPVYRTLRELVMSYFDDYYNYAGERTLRAYSRPVALSRFDPASWARWNGRSAHSFRTSRATGGKRVFHGTFRWPEAIVRRCRFSESRCASARRTG